MWYAITLEKKYADAIMELYIDDFGLPRPPQWFSVVNDYPERLLAGSSFKR